MEVASLERVHMLQNVPTFGGINDGVLSYLLTLSRDLEFSAGEIIFREGDYTASMFIIEEGEVAVYKRKLNEDCLMVVLQSGECLGEMALFDYMPRSASAIAQSDCHLIEITSQNLYQIYKRDIEQFTLIQMNLGREVARRLRRADEQCVRCPNKATDGNTHTFRQLK